MIEKPNKDSFKNDETTLNNAIQGCKFEFAIIKIQILNKFENYSNKIASVTQ